MKYFLILISLLFSSSQALAQISVMSFVEKKLGCYLLKGEANSKYFEIAKWFNPVTKMTSYSFYSCDNDSCGGSASIPVSAYSAFKPDSNNILSYEVYEGTSFRYLSFSEIKSDQEFTVKTLSFQNGSSRDPENDPHTLVYHVEKKLNEGLCPKKSGRPNLDGELN